MHDGVKGVPLWPKTAPRLWSLFPGILLIQTEIKSGILHTNTMHHSLLLHDLDVKVATNCA